MTDDLLLRRKWTFKAHGRTQIFFKRSNESSSHVLMKAFLWALYLPQYPDLAVEVPIGNRYKPDLVAGDKPRFWGESGHVGATKYRYLLGRFRGTHFAFARWASPMRVFQELVEGAMKGTRRTAPVDLISFSEDSPERFIDSDGRISLSWDQLDRVRL